MQKLFILKILILVDKNLRNRIVKSEVGGGERHNPLKLGDPMVGDREFSALRWCFGALCWRDGVI